MNKHFSPWFLVGVFLLFVGKIQAQAVAINDDASLPHASAILDVKVSAALKKVYYFQE